MLILNINNWNELLIGSAVGISVVFIALAALVLCFAVVQYLVVNSGKKKQVKAGKKKEDIVDISSNDIAAISMALHLFFYPTS